MQTGMVLAALAVCVIVIVVTVLGVYYSKVACPDFGSECPEDSTETGTSGTPSGTPSPATRGFVPLQTVTRNVTLKASSPGAPTPGDYAISDGTVLTTWPITNLAETAYIRLGGLYVMKVRNRGFYNFYGYFIDANGNQGTAPAAGQYSSFEVGNFYS
jgi:hypothetical protein